MLQKILTKFSSNPRQLFLIDGLGALLSAFLLGVVLVQLESIFGIPRNTLYFLAFLPCLFAIYDFYCYFQLKKSFTPFLKAIALINLTYCLISIGLAFYHSEKLTHLGWIYIIVEIIIVLILAYIEWKVATQLKANK